MNELIKILLEVQKGFNGEKLENYGNKKRTERWMSKRGHQKSWTHVGHSSFVVLCGFPLLYNSCNDFKYQYIIKCLHVCIL